MGEPSHLPEPSVETQGLTESDREVALRLWIALARCYQTFSHAVAAELSKHGLTTPQFGILEALFHLGRLSLGDLASKLLVTGGNVTYLMDRLEKDGLVIRERCGEDRRVVYASLTPKGEGVMAGVFPEHALAIEQMTMHLDREERQLLRLCLKKLGKGLAGAAEASSLGDV